MKVCEYCSNPFEPDRRTQRFDCEQCQRAWWAENHKWASKKTIYIYICQNCGEQYKTKYRDRNTCCSLTCGWELKSKKAIVEKECLICGKKFKAKQSESDYCSKVCRKKSLERPCVECEKIFIPKHANQIICSLACETKRKCSQYKQHMTKKIGDRIYICKECGKKFIAYYGDKRHKFCSAKCSKKNWYKTEAGKVEKRRQRLYRRAIQYGNGQVERIDFIKIYRRDGWKCGICGKKVDPHLKYPHPMSASLDHIIALSKGGTHTWNNVQCTHFYCNSIKSNVGVDQLRLGIEHANQII